MSRLQQILAQSITLDNPVMGPAQLRTLQHQATTPLGPETPQQPNKALQEKMEFAQSELGQQQMFAEIRRILGLPIILPMSPEQVEGFNRSHILASAYNDGWRLWSIQCQAFAAFQSEGGLFGPIGVGWGKCECADTEVWDLQRGRRRVDEPGPLVTPTMIQGTGRLTTANATAFASGEKDCVRLYLKSGQHVGLSVDHPVFTHRGWVKAGELLSIDLVACPREFPPYLFRLNISDARIRIAAQLIANGATTNGCTLSDEEGPLLEELRADLTSAGFTFTTEPSPSKAVLVRIQGILPLVRDWKIDCLSKNKRVPAEFYNMAEDQTALFLNRFFAADGHVNVKMRLIECTLASEGLIRDLQFMLLRLGVLSRYRYKVSSYVKDGVRHTFDSWKLTISSKTNVQRFFKKVGHLYGQAPSCIAVLEAFKNVKENTNTDIVPIGRKQVIEIAQETGAPRSALRDRLSATDGQWVGRAKFAEWVQETGYIGKYAWLATSDLVWERIDNIKRIGHQPVYDLSVPDTQNFVGNGIVLHNTLIGLMCANYAYAVAGLPKILLLPPSAVYPQLVQLDIRWARSRVPMSVPIYPMGGMPVAARKSLSESGKRGMYIMPHSLLSAKDASAVIAAIDPDLIFIDEAHKFANFGAARTKRLSHFIEHRKKNGRRVRVCAVSGTITAKTLKDYWHLISWCLPDGSPLPRSSEMTNDWATVIDAHSAESGTIGSTDLMQMVHWARAYFPAEAAKFTDDQMGCRAAFQHRLNSAPGVVASGDSEIGTALVMDLHPVADHKAMPGWPQLEALIKKIEDEWTTPNGDPIDHAIHKWKWLFELSGGMYNQLTWPTPAEYAHRKKIVEDQAHNILVGAIAYYEAWKMYATELRSWLQDEARSGLDTPFLVGQDMQRNKAANVGDDLYDIWMYWKSKDFEGRPDRDSTAIRVCDYKINQAIAWAAEAVKNGGAILWVHHQEIGKWLYDGLCAAGLPAMHCPAGDHGNQLIRDPANCKRLAVASISAHGEGKNLQHFQQQWFVQWPRDARSAEQMLGRIHRNGQEADMIVGNMNHTIEFDHANFAACLNDALYIHQTTGNRQKLIYAAYAKIPVIFPSSVLRQRGFENKMLNERQQAMLNERFKV